MKAKVWLSLDKPNLAEGEPVVGKVNVEAKEYVQAEEVRVEARVYENWTEQVWVTVNNTRIRQNQQRKNTLFSRDVRVSGPSDFGGMTQTFPFSVGVPTFKPTRAGGSIEYSLKGVVAVKGRPDITGETQIAFGPPSAFPGMMPPGYGVPGYGPQAGFGPQPGYPQMNPGYGPAPGYGVPPPMVTREVVKVRCRYCNGLMDMGTANCPNCGAKQ